MGLLGDVMDAAKHIGSGAAHLVESGAKDLSNIVTGAGAGLLLGGPAGALIGGYLGSQAGGGANNPTVGGLGPGDLVQRVMQGPGTTSLQDVHQAGVEQSKAQDQIESGSRDLMSGLESAWTGSGSDAARASIQPLADTAASASATLQRNSSLAQDQIGQFESMKNSLHQDVTNTAPERSAWDVGTPWNTSTEDAINDHNQKAQENLARYTDYSSQSTANTGSRTIDYGQLAQSQIGDVTLAPTSLTPPPGPTHGPGGGPTHGPGGGLTEYKHSPPPSGPPPGGPPTPGPGNQPGTSGLPSGGTVAAGYTPPPTSGGFQPGGFGPGGFGPGANGGNSTYSPGGFGGGGAGFGPMGGGFGGGSSGSGGGYGSGSSSGSSSGAGAGSAGAGRGLAGGTSSGAGAPGESAGRPGGSGSASGSAAPGKAGTSGMGGAGKGKGEGGEDAEHSRPSYLMEADTDEIFGSDERTAPPVIGL
ncbi:MAG: hypothetical protein JWQ81_6193 [Amycolatopsis sp.]|uniref:hypothetical protein n=1 Tax=Amycolatopsis sp. TaxID=37632 RepID=UPI0026220A20|nr:hypothetical protein [Amycolatopsis sp.]MCU1685454.1 hypothetical protein [Amycolatopsis sp.]